MKKDYKDNLISTSRGELSWQGIAFLLQLETNL